MAVIALVPGCSQPCPHLVPVLCPNTVEFFHKEQCLAEGISPPRLGNTTADSLSRNFTHHYEQSVHKDVLHQIFRQWGLSNETPLCDQSAEQMQEILFQNRLQARFFDRSLPSSLVRSSDICISSNSEGDQEANKKQSNFNPHSTGLAEAVLVHQPTSALDSTFHTSVFGQTTFCLRTKATSSSLAYNLFISWLG